MLIVLETLTFDLSLIQYKSPGNLKVDIALCAMKRDREGIPMFLTSSQRVGLKKMVSWMRRHVLYNSFDDWKALSSASRKGGRWHMNAAKVTSLNQLVQVVHG